MIPFIVHVALSLLYTPIHFITKAKPSRDCVAKTVDATHDIYNSTTRVAEAPLIIISDRFLFTGALLMSRGGRNVVRDVVITFTKQVNG